MNDITLLIELKEELQITYSYEDKRLERLLKSAQGYFENKVGKPVLFDTEVKKTLLFNYCRYARSANLEWFEVNYISDILDLMISENKEK
ncbi:MAG: phage head-tail connector protein [Paraclostridium sp.]